MVGVKLGDRVKLQGKALKGEVAFIGETDFSDGLWIGIILDNVKGRHDGAVDGKRYFKCPRNRGIFVRACQVEKEYPKYDDENDRKITRTAYPNYLKASSKLKSDKHTYESKNDVLGTELENNDDNDQPNETDSSEGNVNRSEFEAVKVENNTLKEELEAREKSMQEAQYECTKALEEIKQLKRELECKNKQIRVQKCNIKLLKMRQCKHYKKADCFVAPNKKSKASKKGDISATEGSLADDLNVSDDEFDFECLKAMASMQRLVELEEQNRIMIQGLVELREFLKSISQSQVLDFEIPDVKTNHSKKVSNPHFFSTLINSSARVQSNESIPAEVSALHLKKYTNMLREMTDFPEYEKEKKSLRIQNRSFDQIGDFNIAQSGSRSGDKMSQHSYQLPNHAQINKPCFGKSSIQVESTGFQNTLTTSCNNFTNSFQTKINGNSQKPHNLYTVPNKYEDPVDELTQLMSSMSANSNNNICHSKTSFLQQNPLESLNPTLKSITGTAEFQLSQPKSGMEVAVNSVGDGALVLPAGKKPQKRMILSTQIINDNMSMIG